MISKKSDIEIVYRISNLYKFEVHFLDYISKSINDFLKLNEHVKFEYENVCSFVEIVHVSNGKVQDNVFGFFKFKISFEPAFGEFDGKINITSQEEYNQLMMLNVIYFFRLCVKSLIFISHIAFPGGLKLINENIFVDGIESDNEAENIVIPNDLRLVIDYTKEIGWPNFQMLKCIDVYKWMFKNDYSFIRVSKSSTERALAAFSHLFETSLAEVDFHLLWSLLGIEAIYCTERKNILKQLRNNIRLVMGDVKNHTKLINQMYDFRSRFVHGNTEIPPLLCEAYSTNEDEKFNDRKYAVTKLSIAILICSIQEMIVKDMNKFSFK